MRYMMLVYSRETSGGVEAAHDAVIREASRQGVLRAAELLAPTCTATTVRVTAGRAVITDGPFAETTEQLAGYYILECENLDVAIEWAARIPAFGSVEIRPIPGRPSPEA